MLIEYVPNTCWTGMELLYLICLSGIDDGSMSIIIKCQPIDVRTSKQIINYITKKKLNIPTVWRKFFFAKCDVWYIKFSETKTFDNTKKHTDIYYGRLKLITVRFHLFHCAISLWLTDNKGGILTKKKQRKKTHKIHTDIYYSWNRSIQAADPSPHYLIMAHWQ